MSGKRLSKRTLVAMTRLPNTYPYLVRASRPTIPVSLATFQKTLTAGVVGRGDSCSSSSDTSCNRHLSAGRRFLRTLAPIVSIGANCQHWRQSLPVSSSCYELFNKLRSLSQVHRTSAERGANPGIVPVGMVWKVMASTLKSSPICSGDVRRSYCFRMACFFPSLEAASKSACARSRIPSPCRNSHCTPTACSLASNPSAAEWLSLTAPLLLSLSQCPWPCLLLASLLFAVPFACHSRVPVTALRFCCDCCMIADMAASLGRPRDQTQLGPSEERTCDTGPWATSRPDDPGGNDDGEDSRDEPEAATASCAPRRTFALTCSNLSLSFRSMPKSCNKQRVFTGAGKMPCACSKRRQI